MTYAPLSDYWVEHAIREVSATYGDTISVFAKKKSLLKFGRNETVGTSDVTVWTTGGNETYQTTNAINRVVSTDAADTQSVVIEGHTVSGGVFTFVSQTATLNGTTAVTLTTPLARATRIYNNGSTDFAGTVTVFVNGSTTHLTATGSDNQSFKASTTVSNTDYWLITEVYGVVDEKTAAAADFKFQVREQGKVFRTRLPGSAKSDGPAFYAQLRPYLIVPKNADFRIRAVASTTNVSVEAWANGPLASVI